MEVCESEYRQVGGTDAGGRQHFTAGGGAPPATQDYTLVEQTPVPEQGRQSTRETIPPEPLTYSQHHTRAGQAAERRGRRRGGKRGHI